MSKAVHVLKEMDTQGGRVAVFTKGRTQLIIGNLQKGKSTLNGEALSLSLTQAYERTPPPKGTEWMRDGLDDDATWNPLNDQGVFRISGKVSSECIKNNGNFCLTLHGGTLVLLLCKEDILPSVGEVA